jgi:Fe-S cluster assembly protein SufD
MVFINGIFSPERSRLDDLPDGVRISNLATRLDSGDVPSFELAANEALAALNTAFMADGFCLTVGENVTVDGLLGLSFHNDGSAPQGMHSRNIVVLERNASLSIMERHDGEGRYFANPQTRISLAESARLDHYRLQNESPEAFHIALTECDLAAGARYDSFVFSIGGRLSRNEIRTALCGADAASHLGGAYLMRGNQHCDNALLTEHRVPDNTSSQTYKGVLDDRSHGVFQGKIHIFRDAQRTAGDQLSKALLLSDHAAVDCKPELEIYADDVKCSHGATTGELDETALFYLQTRGIPLDRARQMLIEAFLADVLETAADPEVRKYFNEIAFSWLEKA